MKIYVGFTVVGDRNKIDLVRHLILLLQKRGHDVLTTHILSPDIRAEESLKEPEEILQRDLKWLNECDAFIAEVSRGSFGVGFEAGFLLDKKKIYLLYDYDLKENVSRMARGLYMHPNCISVEYKTLEDINKFVEENF